MRKLTLISMLGCLLGFIGFNIIGLLSSPIEVPTAQDAEAAASIGHFIAEGYGLFDERSEVERSGKGKIYFVGPKSHRNSIITIYEVTSPSDLQRIESLANQALSRTPEARGVIIEFYANSHKNSNAKPFKILSLSQ